LTWGNWGGMRVVSAAFFELTALFTAPFQQD